MIYNVNRGKNKKALNWSNIFPEYEDRRQKTPDELLSIAEILNEAFGGTDLRHKDNPPTA